MANFLLSCNVPQFVSNIVKSIWDFFGMKNLTTTTYHPQTNVKTERYKKFTVSRLNHYADEHQLYWDKYFQPLTYAHNAQMYVSTKFNPLSLILPRYSLVPTIIYSQSSPPTDETWTLSAKHSPASSVSVPCNGYQSIQVVNRRARKLQTILQKFGKVCTYLPVQRGSNCL